VSDALWTPSPEQVADANLTRFQEHLLRTRKGLPSVDPLEFNARGEAMKLRSLGLKWSKSNKLVKADSR